MAANFILSQIIYPRRFIMVLNISRFFITIVLIILSHTLIAQQKIDDFIIPRLSPRPAAVSGITQTQLSLNGKWNFRISNTSAHHNINVPGEWVMQGFTVNEGETAIYTLPLNIPFTWKGKRIKLRFDGVSTHATIKINGQTIGEHEGSFVPFEFDITKHIRPTGNTLEVDVQAQTIGDQLGRTSQYAAHVVGGILRKVTLFALPNENIASNYANTTFDASFQNATLKITSGLNNESARTSPAQLEYTLMDATGKVITHQLSGMLSLNNASTATETIIPIQHPQQWNPEHPYLYRLKTTLLIDGKPAEQISQRIGFRQIEVKGNQLLVNGQVVKLHGANRHSVHPLTGRSVSPTLDRQDAMLFRNANCNYIRTSHYPPSEEFLDAADELGLFVESEASLCWVTHGTAPIWKDWNYTDERYLPYLAQANIENVQAGRNHPSIIMWSLANESAWSPLFVRVNALVKKLDPSRPTSFHDQCWGSFNNQHSQADIANYHYPGTHETAMADTMPRPVLFGEYAHISCYSRRELVTDPGIRASYGKPLQQLYDSIYHHKGALGGAIWAGIDDTFHLPDGRIVGYGPWGLLDGWRRPKPEYWGVKKAYSPVRITRINWDGKSDAVLTVENRYDFTSLQNIGIEATINGKVINIKSQIPPHSSGQIKIPTSGAQSFRIVFKDPRGFVADEENYEVPHEQAQQQFADVPWQMGESGNVYTLSRGNIRCNINKRTGMIISIRKGDAEILTQGPSFCIMSSNTDDGGKAGSVTYQNDIYPLKTYPANLLYASNVIPTNLNGEIRVAMDIFYSDIKGKLSYTFARNGRLSVQYELTYIKANSTISPYQYGLLLQLPESFTMLNWQRQGEFSSYPANDLARSNGTTLLNARHTTGVEEWRIQPTHDWKDDANEMGSADFRATKRYILNASLQDQHGNKVSLISNGKQASRSWLQDHRINWLIADYCNNGSERYYAAPFTDDRIKIAEGAVMKGGVTLVIE